MRTLLCAIPAFLRWPAGLAEPQQLTKLTRGVAAAKTDISMSAGSELSTNSSSTSSLQETNQALNGISSNTTYATGVSSSDVGAVACLVHRDGDHRWPVDACLPPKGVRSDAMLLIATALAA